MNKGEMLYEGKAKQVFATENPEEVIVKFKDDATAFNAQKRGSFDLKGEMNNAITTLIFEYLQEKGIPTHFIKQLNEREQLVRKVSIIPLEMVVRNYAAGSMAERLGEELDEMYALTNKINELLKELFDKMNIILVDFKIELGKTSDGKIILADEISPDTCRLWDKDTMKKLDKDRFRRDLGEVTEAYVEIYERLKKALGK